MHPLQEVVFQKLRDTFHAEAIFFWNGNKGTEIGLKWRPHMLQPCSFNILSCQNRTVSADGTAGGKDSGSGGNGSGGSGAPTTPNLPQLLSKMLDLADGLLVGVEFTRE